MALLSAASYAAAAPQDAPVQAPTAGIFGRVVNAETHDAVRRAVIKVYTSKDQWDEFTDGEGRFRFPTLAPGEYTLIGHRDGYTDRAYKVERSDFDEKKELPIELHPQAVITGKVVNGFGEALQSARIQALGSRTRGGKTEVLNSAETNDLGEYRLSGLDPGTYQVRATYREGGDEFDPTPRTTATSYYGGAEKPAEIDVKAGSVVTGIDFTLNPVRPATVRGTLRSETGELAERAMLWIMGQAGEGGHNGSSENGKFEIGDVSPGAYTISAETLNKTSPLFGMVTVQVRGADVDGVELVLRPMPKIEGEVRVEGGGTADLKLGSIYFVRSEPVTVMDMQIGHPDKDGRFTVALIPGEYSLSFDASIRKLGAQKATLDDKPITSWKLQMGEASGTKKLVIVVGSNPRQ